MRLLPAALSAIRRLPKKELADRTIAESLTEQCGHKTFQIFWILSGLRATLKESQGKVCRQIIRSATKLPV
jgi:hypothetical protein